MIRHSLTAVSLVVLVGCHTRPPSSPATPFVRFPQEKVWFARDPMPIFARWYTTCTRTSVGWADDEGHSDHLKDIMMVLFPPLIFTRLRHVESVVDCDGQRYAVRVSCTRSCSGPPAPLADRLVKEGIVHVTVREPGPTRISLTLVNLDTDAAVVRSSESIVFVDPDQVQLQCLDPATDEFASCAERALDPAHPFVRAALAGAVLPMAIDRTAHVVDVELGADAAPGGRVSLDEVLGVRPLPPGAYDVELRLRSTGLTRPRAVHRRVVVGRSTR
jgi:hypothetical protein